MQQVYECLVMVDIQGDNTAIGTVQDANELLAVILIEPMKLEDEGTVSIKDYLKKVPEIVN